MKGLLSIYPLTLRISYKYFSLKKHYDPEGEDALTERVIILVENGQV